MATLSSIKENTVAQALIVGCAGLRFKEIDMFLKYSTRKGHFNWSDPSEESYSCHVAVYDNDANRVKYCNFTPEYKLKGTDVDEITAELEDSMNRYWSTNDDRKEMIAYLKDNQLEIEKGNDERRLAEIKTELDALTEEKERIEKRLFSPHINE